MHSQIFTKANGDRDYAPNMVVVVTDSESDLQSAVYQSDMARDKGIDFMAIGVGEQVW